MIPGYTAADVRAIRESYGCSMFEAKKICLTEAMFSAVVQVELHLDNDELKEAIKLQNELLTTIITEIRKL